MPKSVSERVRAYRERQRALRSPKPPPKSGTERVREFRARQKILRSVETVLVELPEPQLPPIINLEASNTVDASGTAGNWILCPAVTSESPAEPSAIANTVKNAGISFRLPTIDSVQSAAGFSMSIDAPKNDEPSFGDESIKIKQEPEEEEEQDTFTAVCDFSSAEESNLDNPSNPLDDAPVGEYVLPTVPKDVQAATTPIKIEGSLDSPSTSSSSFDQPVPLKNSYLLPTKTIIHSNALVPTTIAHVSLLKRKRTVETPKSATTETDPSDESTKKLKSINDEFTHFGNNVASQLRNMSLEKALLCQNEIMMVLMKYRVEAQQTSSSSSLSPTLPQSQSNSISISNIKVEVIDS